MSVRRTLSILTTTALVGAAGVVGATSAAAGDDDTATAASPRSWPRTALGSTATPGTTTSSTPPSRPS